MDAATRRGAVTQALQSAQAPRSATALAQEFGVSRQVIVGDIALLRAGGLAVSATPRGYVLDDETAPGIKKVVACTHGAQEMEQELQIMVDNGCTVEDVVVEHPTYGQLTGPLGLSNRYEVSEFIRTVEKFGVKPLSDLTGGVHLHTIRCPDEAAYRRVMQALAEAGMLFQGEGPDEQEL